MTDTPAAAPAPAESTIQKIEDGIHNVVVKVENVVETAWNDVKTGVTILKDEGTAIVNWADANIPGAAPVIQGFMVKAEQAASALAQAGATGLDEAITDGGAQLDSVVGQVLQKTGLVYAAGNAPGTLSSAAVSTAQTLLTNMVTASLARVLAMFAPAAAAS